MNGTSQQLLDFFERLPEAEKQQVAIEILRRTLSVEVTQLTEDELTLSAEAIFLSLDEEEVREQQSESG